ncbi:hypothetical protein BKA65DRAFT_192609 [Rhexocercosporidium sp. MPI-PUGE-AT-0058]|nr:hypothetical protein BKA65DRAFT_192609 [Rhexocercosporidium sp. MPI-PUGE-AT-0058]
MTKKIKTTEAMFQNTVLDVLKDGGHYHPKLEAALIEDDNIKAYLIVPNQSWRQTGPSDTGYPDMWKLIRTTVGSIVPTLQDEARWKTIVYAPVEGKNAKDILNSPYRSEGKIIFKHDPEHAPGADKPHMSALWVEEKQVHLDTW